MTFQTTRILIWDLLLQGSRICNKVTYGGRWSSGICRYSLEVRWKLSFITTLSILHFSILYYVYAFHDSFFTSGYRRAYLEDYAGRQLKPASLFLRFEKKYWRAHVHSHYKYLLKVQKPDKKVRSVHCSF